MTAAEILRSAAPPPDDELIEKAIADLDTKIWEWADALKHAHEQLQVSFAPPAAPVASQAAEAPAAPPPAAKQPAARPSAALYDIAPSSSSLSAAAAAAHIPSPPPMPAEWTAPPVADGASDRLAKDMPWRGKDADEEAASPSSPEVRPAWPESPAAVSARMPAEVPPSQPASSDSSGVMAWPTAPSGGWPDSSTSSSQGGTDAQPWPTWTPTDTSAAGSAAGSAKPVRKGAGGKPVHQRMATRQNKAPIKTSVEGPSPEEKARRAAEEEALLAKLDDAIARRVRLLRRLDPDTPINQLIDKAKQGQAEAAAAPSTTGDGKSSWWRRK